MKDIGDIGTPCSKEEAIAKIEVLRKFARQCESAGFVGAVLDNEREIARLRRQWSV